ncbi:hypothetical protein AK812_SmicGene11553 [Symbiodinium microadriaticum]|uniref:Uncharacterized protein n=1 Tax=Symbiodinium microadriaticum TaxID=2951 RepID=A0A1Q9ED38_SYMMI|nr:hypothetical protein AK812_SmicGene11553 [Symbiodinium microadriaticum]CAE7857987.1 unnamed protein product [Symbiodinium microadriaticum]CAE7923318.1 unnamed protein product [Symbiodinium sp. KB8]
MESAGSGDEPTYGGQDRASDGSVSMVRQGRQTAAIQMEVNLSASDDAGVDGVHASQREQEGGVRSPEQEAADVLAMADGLEPEYEFQSVEGNGAGSPEQVAADGLFGDRGSEFDAAGPGENRTPRVLAGYGRDPGRPQLNGVVERPLSSRGAGDDTRQALSGEVVAASRPPRRADGSWREDDGGALETERIGVLETLVQQLLKQNEHLMRELSDRDSRASGESGRSGRLDPVQTAERKVEGDRLLAATRAMQSLSIEDYDPSGVWDQRGLLTNGAQVLSWTKGSQVYPWIDRQGISLEQQQPGVSLASAEQEQELTLVGLEDGDTRDFRIEARGLAMLAKEGSLRGAISEATIREAAQILQSMKISALRADLDSASQVDEAVALDLINQYELYVGHQDNRNARLQCIVEDLSDMGTSELVEVIRKGDAHGDAAFWVFVDRMIPDASREVRDNCCVSLQDDAQETSTWNRRTRRKCAKSQGIIIHAFCGKAKRAFEHIAHKWDFAHLSVDASEDLLNDTTYRFLLQQARDGKIRALVGSPSSRTFSAARYVCEANGQGPRPIRVPGESIGGYGVKDLSCQERAQRSLDDTLILRFMILMGLSVEANRRMGVPDPACVIEHPCLEEEVGTAQGVIEDSVKASLWSTPEWKILKERAGLGEFRFFQRPMGHQKRRPTCLGSNLGPDPTLVECCIPAESLDYVPRKDFRAEAELWNEWAPGLVQAVSSMLHRAFGQMRRMISGGWEMNKLDPGFINHLKQNHVPYRNDCATCLRGSAKRKQHRRVLTPQAWTLSVDTAGPFAKGKDEHTMKARYLVVGVLSVPTLAVTGSEVTDPMDADPGPVPVGGGVLDDAEWLADEDGAGDELEPDLPARELSEARSAWNEWEKLVESSREDWLAEAQTESGQGCFLSLDWDIRVQTSSPDVIG